MEAKKISKQIEIGSRLDFAKIFFVLAIATSIGVVYYHNEALQEAAKFSMSRNGNIRITVVNAINERAVMNYENSMILRDIAFGFTLIFAGIGYALRKSALNLRKKNLE